LQLLIVFVAALTANLAFDISHVCQRVIFAPDGQHYLLTSQKLTEFFLTIAQGKPNLSLLLSRPCSEPILFDGPIVSLIPALAFTFLGHIPAASNWPTIAIISSCMQAMSACLICILTYKVTQNRVAAGVAGLLFIFYPGALIASARFCSEVPTVFFSLLFLLGLSGSSKLYPYAIIAGVSAGFLVMCKAALIPVTIFAIFWTAFKSSRKSLVFFLISGFFVFTVLPWSIYTKIITGKVSITAERMPAYNAAIGTDLTTNGWTTLPESAYTQSVDQTNKPSSILINQWLKHPSELMILVVRRCTRLFAQPWNSFRQSVFGVSPIAQLIFHIILLAFGILGISLYCLVGRSQANFETRITGDLSIIFFLGHFCYVLFQAIARYALSAMPIFIIFAVYGCHFLIHNRTGLSKTASRKAIAIAAILALFFVISIESAESLTYIGQPAEVSISLKNGDMIKKVINMPAGGILKHPAQQALILVDGDKNVCAADLLINGHKITSRLNSINNFSSKLYYIFATMAEYAHYMDFSIDDFRQWRAVPVPIDWLRADGSNTVVLIGRDNGIKLYADSQPNVRTMLSPGYFAHDQVFNNLFSLEPRILSQSLTEPVQQFSSITRKTGDIQNLSCSVRIKLALLSYSLPKRMSGNNTLPIFKTALLPVNFDPMLRNENFLKIDRNILKFAKNTKAEIMLPPIMGGSHYLIRIIGQYRTSKNGAQMGILPSIYNGTQFFRLSTTPNYLIGKTDWRNFVIEDLVPSAVFKESPNKLSIGLYPCAWRDAWLGCDRCSAVGEVKDIAVTIQALNLPDIAKGKTMIY
jgi:hypothetical protein